MRKILVIAYQFPPYGGGSVIRIHNFCKYFREFGFEPHVLSVSEKYYDSAYRAPELLAELEGKIRLYRSDSLEPEAKNFRDKVFGLKKRSALDALIIPVAKAVATRLMVPDRNVLWHPRAVALGKRVIRENGIEAVFSTAPPFTSHLVAGTLARRFRLPLFLDYRDDWVDNPAFMKHGGLTRWLNWRMEKAMVLRSAHVFCATEYSRAFLLRKYRRLEPGRVSVLANGFDPEYFDPAAFRSLRNGSGKLRILYVGSLSPDRNPEPLFLALVRMRGQAPALLDSLRISFYGYAPQATRARSEELGLSPQVVFHDGVPPRQVPRLLAEECDVALSLQSAKGGGDTAIPGKLYEYMAMGRPILNLSERGAVWGFLEGLGSDYNAHYADPEAIYAMLERMAREHADGTLKSPIRAEDTARFNRKHQTGALCGVLQGHLR